MKSKINSTLEKESFREIAAQAAHLTQVTHFLMSPKSSKMNNKIPASLVNTPDISVNEILENQVTEVNEVAKQPSLVKRRYDNADSAAFPPA